jgi:PAS domain S-box-containing protein
MINRISYLTAALLFLAALFVGLSLVAITWWHTNNIEQATLLRAAESYAKAINAFRNLYTTEVIGKISGSGLSASPFFSGETHTIPIPATMNIEVARYINSQDSKIHVAVVSDYPFPWRARRALGSFERSALQRMTSSNLGEYHELVEEGGQRSLKYATPMRMDAACVACHNALPDSPKRDWKLGDVRGLLVVSLPVGLNNAESRLGLAYLVSFIILSFIVAFSLILWLFNRNQLAFAELSRKGRRLEQTLTELNFFKDALDQHAIVSIADVAGNITYANNRFCEISGYRREQVLGQNHRLVRSNEHSAAFFEDMWRRIGSGQVWHGEIKNRASDGSFYWVNSTIVPFLDEQGRPFQYVSIRTDITQRKRMEAEKEKDRNFLVSLTNAIGDGVYAQDEQGNFLFVNTAAARLLGWSAQELLGQPVHSSIHHHSPEGEPVASADCAILRAILEGREYRSDQEYFWRRDGSGFPVEVVAVPLRQGQGRQERIIGTVVAFQDISARLQAQQELARAKESAEQANQAKSQFLANMSHEIRTPMNAIIGMSYLALQTPLDQRQRDYIEKVNRSAESLLGIINDILDFSKIEANRMELEQVPFRLDEVLENLINMVGIRAYEKQLEFIIDLSPGAPLALVGDSLRLTQVLINLCTNAIKFTEQGRVCLSIRPLTDAGPFSLQFAVQDTGIGMSQIQRARLFQSFAQADASTTRKYGGTGLGLVISQRLVELMGGQIRVESQPGQGSRFSFSADFGLDPAARDAIYAAEVVEWRGRRVLLLETDSEARRVSSGLLRALGLEVLLADDCAQALDLLAGAGDCPLLLDCRLLTPPCPSLSPLLARIEPRRPILVSASSWQEQRQQLPDPRLQDARVLAKPLLAGHLLDALCDLWGCDQRSAARQSSETGLAEAKQQLAGAHLLLVEDNEFNQQLAVDLLNASRIRVEVACNGQEALACLQVNRYDGVLMDCQMPVMDGYSASRAIRAQARYADLPIIAMTANAMAEDVQKALDAGMNDHIAKPINVAGMFRTLAKWIRPSPQPTAVPAEISLFDDEPFDEEAEQAELAELAAGLDLRGLQSLNWERALARLEGDELLYGGLLRKFAENQADVLDRLQQALQQQDRDSATRLAHTLKATAASVGAEAVAQLAEALELRLKQGEPLQAQSLPPLQQALTPVLVELGQLLPESARTVQGAAGSGLEGPQLHQGLQELRARMENFDVSGEEVLAGIIQSLDNPALSADLTRLRRLLGNYDFEGGLALLDDILQGIGQGSGQGGG